MSSTLRPRLCVIEKGEYGFHLYGEKGKTVQFIRLVEPDSLAETAGLRTGDRLMFVNEENVEGMSHKQVVSRIMASKANLELIVVDQETEELLKKHNLKCLKEFVTEGIPLPSSEWDAGVGEMCQKEQLSCRELKHRAVQQPNEPKFQIHDYKSSCCRIL